MPGATAAERGRDVRRKLVSAAAELIAEVGWTAVSTRMLAERAGVAPGLVHYHFASVQALLAEAALGVMREVVGGVGPALDGVTTRDDAIAVVTGVLDRYDGRDPTSLLFAEAFLAATRDEALRQSLAQVLADFRRQLAQRFDRLGVAEPDQTAAVVAATVDGLMLHRALVPDLTAAAVTPVLRRLVATPARRRSGTRKEGTHR